MLGPHPAPTGRSHHEGRMSKPIREILSPEAVQQALDAAFAGQVPGFVAALVDAEHAARHTGDSYFSLAFRTDGEREVPRLRLRPAPGSDERARVEALVVARFPGAQAVFDAHAEAQVIVDTDGADLRLHHFAPGTDGPPDSGYRDVPAEGPAGPVVTMHYYEHAPTDLVPGPLAARAERFLSAAGGMWLTGTRDGAVEIVGWSTEKWFPGASELVASISGGAAQGGAFAALRSCGGEVNPVSVEFYADGSTCVCAWAVQQPALELAQHEHLLGEDGAVRGDKLADTLALTVPPEAQDDARALVADALFPAIQATVPAGKALSTHAIEAFDWILVRLARETPFERPKLLRQIVGHAQLAAWKPEIERLALARYLQAHPDAPRPDGFSLPADVADADADTLVSRAQARLDEVARVEAALRDAPTDVVAAIPFLTADLDALRDALQRTVSGDFTAASGVVHEFLSALGAGGYDDDPSIASLADIDLEAGGADEAVAEALGLDDEWDDF